MISASGSRLWIGRQTEWDVPVESYDRQAILDQFRLDRDPWKGGAVRRDERLTREVMIREVASGDSCFGWYGLMYPVDPLGGLDTADGDEFGYVTVCVQAPEASGPVLLVGLWPEEIVLSAERGSVGSMEVSARCAREQAAVSVAGIGGEMGVPLVMGTSAVTTDGVVLPVVRFRLQCRQEVTSLDYVCGVDTVIARPRVLRREWTVRMWIAARDADLRAMESWECVFTAMGESEPGVRVNGSDVSLVSSHERVIEDRVGVEATWLVGAVTMEWV
jgi:hypothetical protein